MTDFRQKQLTDITWKDSGGSEVITLTSLAASGGCRAGEEHDFTTGGASNPFVVKVRVQIDLKFAVAPTAGGTVLVEWSSSIDGTNYDGECTGSDAAYTHTDRLDHVLVLVVSNDTDVQRFSRPYFLPARWGLPVVQNNADQAFSATAADCFLTVTPLVDTDDNT